MNIMYFHNYSFCFNYFFIKAFSFLLFKEKELFLKWLEKLEKHLPMTVMAVLDCLLSKDLKMQLTTLLFLIF